MGDQELQRHCAAHNAALAGRQHRSNGDERVAEARLTDAAQSEQCGDDAAQSRYDENDLSLWPGCRQ